MVRVTAATAIAACLLMAGGAQGQIPPSDPPASAADLGSGVSDPRVRQFYELRGGREAWTGGRAEALVEAIGQAERHGLDPRMFLDAIDAAASPGEREGALTLAAITYGEALARGVADPAKLHRIYTLERPRANVAADLARAIDTGDLRDWFERLAPQDAEYRALSEAYLRSRARAGTTSERDIPAGGLMREGSQDPRVPAIAEALTEAGYPAPPAGSDLYDAEMAAAVRAFQADFGLKADGVVGPATLAAINTGSGERARQLALNLERRRWLAREVPQRRVDVNTAATLLTYYRDGASAWSTRVVVGAARTPTPALGSPITRLVVNPPWYVPDSIANAEILPKGDAYLRANDMYVKDGRVIQRAGPQAALGQVKFDMDNEYAIYLHDTPAKALFERNERHRSHGCVRVQNALEFARLLAEEEGKGADFDARLASGETGTVDLEAELPVRLLYHTAYLDEAGAIVFRPDVYGWDEELAKALGMTTSGRLRIDDGGSIPIGP